MAFTDLKTSFGVNIYLSWFRFSVFVGLSHFIELIIKKLFNFFNVFFIVYCLFFK